jgi:hypothetical protein
MSAKAILAGGCLLLSLVVVLGCGKPAPKMEAGRGKASGTITVDGKPLRGGTIFFVSATDPTRRVVVSIKPDGTFSVADAPTGDVLISVDNESQKGNNPDAYVPLPAKYKKEKTSGLTAKITGEPITIELSSK